MKYTHSLSQQCEICDSPIGKSSNSRRKLSINVCGNCMRETPSAEYRCSAQIGKGTAKFPIRRCRRWAEANKKKCGVHSKEPIHTQQGSSCPICKLPNVSRNGKTSRVCFTCRAAGPKGEDRCQGINSVKKQCKHWALDTTQWCYHHTPKEESQ